VADALRAAAERGIIHRDVKPLNVLLDDRGVAKLTDFGMAKVIEGAAGEVSRGVGTIAYMPPEQFAVGSDITSAADIFSLGVTLWVLLTGAPPLPHGGLTLSLGQAPPRLREVWPACPADLDELLARMLASDAGDRPSAAAVREALNARPATAAAFAGDERQIRDVRAA